jgi:hypothetical protein
MDGDTSAFLLDLYFSHGWCEHKPKKGVIKNAESFIEYMKTRDPLGNPITLYCLNGRGKEACAWLLRKLGHADTVSRGMVIEERLWHVPTNKVLPKGKMIKAFKEFAVMANIPIDVKCLDEKEVRIVLTDTDRGIARVSSEVDWEKDRDLKRLKVMLDWSDELLWLWSYFDRSDVRKKIRELPHKQEFVVWG